MRRMWSKMFDQKRFSLSSQFEFEKVAGAQGKMTSKRQKNVKWRSAQGRTFSCHYFWLISFLKTNNTLHPPFTREESFQLKSEAEFWQIDYNYSREILWKSAVNFQNLVINKIVNQIADGKAGKNCSEWQVWNLYFLKLPNVKLKSWHVRIWSKKSKYFKINESK